MTRTAESTAGSGGSAQAADQPGLALADISAASEQLRDALVQAFARQGWPSRLIVAEPTTAAEAVALDLFAAALRLDLPDIALIVR